MYERLRSDPRDIGAVRRADGTTAFRVWAPLALRVDVCVRDRGEGEPRRVAMVRDEHGYHSAEIPGLGADVRYAFSLDGGPERPDPASRWQPDGVHAPSALDDPAAYAWRDAGWRSPALRSLVIYELHVGTYTREGTLDAVIPYLAGLRELGINAIEVMPVSQFAGGRNWGYDGVYPFSVQSTYGGPAAFRRFVDACHAAQIAVILDVVYNHVGPEGNYLREFGPYFTAKYATPWGEALNFDDEDSDAVRAFFIASARMYVRDHHVDGFRLDAIHAILDRSADPFLAELADAVRAEAALLGLGGYVIAESDMNDPRVLRARASGGLGQDAQWADDLHHALHVGLTGETYGYYADFTGVAHLADSLREPFVYRGQYSAYRRRRHGAAPEGFDGSHFVVCAQNHDQVGNRMMGERIAQLVPPAQVRVAAAAYLLSPYVPLIFMGEEWGETAPFQYFTSHDDPALGEAVRNGRREEFASFQWQGEAPDPQDPATFERSRVDHVRAAGEGSAMRRYYAELLRLRRDTPAFSDRSRERVRVERSHDVLLVRRGTGACVVLSFSDEPARVPLPDGSWRIALDSGDTRWGGEGAAARVAATVCDVPPRCALVLLA